MNLNPFREMIEAAELEDWYRTENARVLKDAQDAYAAAVQAQASTVTPLDLAWEQINALGGVPMTAMEMIQVDMIGQCLEIIERLGGVDPGRKRVQRLVAINAELQGIADDIAALKPEDEPCSKA